MAHRENHPPGATESGAYSDGTPGAIIRGLLDYWESHPNEDWITTWWWPGGDAHEVEARGSFIAFSGTPSRLSEIESGCSRRGLRFAASELKRSVGDVTRSVEESLLGMEGANAALREELLEEQATTRSLKNQLDHQEVLSTYSIAADRSRLVYVTIIVCT